MATAPLPPTTPDVSTAPSQPALSQVERIVNTFIAPSKTFTDIRRSGAWWMPFLLVALASWGLTYTAGSKVGFDKMAETQMQARPKQVERMDSMPPAERARAMQFAGKFTAGISYAIPIVVLLFVLIFAAIDFGALKVAGGSDARFGKVYAVMIYAGLPGALKSILGIIALLAGASPDSFNLQNPIGSSLAYYLNPADSPFLYALGSQLDIFLIWTLVLTAIGFICISKVKKGTAFAIVFGVWIFFTLFFSSFALLG